MKVEEENAFSMVGLGLRVIMGWWAYMKCMFFVLNVHFFYNIIDN